MNKMRGALLGLAQALLIIVSLFVLLEGWQRDIHVPLGFSSDSLFYLMQSKGTIDNGWWWFNPMLGAPFGLNELAFPSNSNVDQAIVWLTSRFVTDAAASVNLAWAFMVVLSGLTATWCLRRIGASTSSAIAAGTLFALTPYALYLNIGHFAMVIYLVPFVCTAALMLVTGRLPERGSWTAGHVAVLAGCALLGFNYVYYAFFGCFLIVVAAIAGVLTYGDRRILAAAAVCLTVIGGATLLNLAPSFYVLNRDGNPIILRDKVPAEAELYGLKIRHLISPVTGHWFPPFRSWVDKERAAQFPLETENAISRLGVVGTTGFLGLLFLMLVPGLGRRIGDGGLLLGAGQLTFAAVLLGTIGGFGSLFSLLVSPEIRAYTRISPFIAFFSLAAVAWLLDALVRARSSRILAALLVLAVGVADQGMAATGLNANYKDTAAELPALKEFVRQLESRLPERPMVLQLPLRTFLNDEGVARMQPYDHLKLYVVSHGVRWSYPALSNKQVRWQQAAGALDPQRLALQVASEGFAAIVVDRYGYADNAAAVIAALRTRLGPASILAESERYLAFDLRSLARVDAATPRSTGPPVPASGSLPACGSTEAAAQFNLIGQERGPFAGRVVHLPRAGSIKVNGWAIDQPHQRAAAGVDVVVDKTAFPSLFGTDRADVADYFKQPIYRSSGFSAEIATGTLPPGEHRLSLRVVPASGECYSEVAAMTVVIDR